MTVIAEPLTSPSTLEPLTWQWQGHKINYIVKGRGLPVVLVHGFGASIGHWRKNIPALVEGGYRVFALDLLGFGGFRQSSRGLFRGTVARTAERFLG
jgi:pimeloyl-ACP methyl ester carboxylesterase